MTFDFRMDSLINFTHSKLYFPDTLSLSLSLSLLGTWTLGGWMPLLFFQQNKNSSHTTNWELTFVGLCRDSSCHQRDRTIC